MGLFLVIACGVTLMVIGLVQKKNGGYGDGDLWIIIAIVILTVCFTCFGCCYINSMGEIAELDAFYSSTKETYKAIITESEAIEINIPIMDNSTAVSAQGLAYFQLAFTVSGRIREFGEEIAKYNSGLFRYRRYNANWFTGGFIAEVPEYLKPIVLNLSN